MRENFADQWKNSQKSEPAKISCHTVFKLILLNLVWSVWLWVCVTVLFGQGVNSIWVPMWLKASFTWGKDVNLLWHPRKGHWSCLLEIILQRLKVTWWWWWWWWWRLEGTDHSHLSWFSRKSYRSLSSFFRKLTTINGFWPETSLIIVLCSGPKF